MRSYEEDFDQRDADIFSEILRQLYFMVQLPEIPFSLAEINKT